MMKDSEIKQLENELRNMLDKKLNRKYVCVLSLHNETKGDQITCTTFQLTNINLTSDAFSLCNVLFAGLKGGTEQFLGRVFGTTAMPKQESVSSYHQ
jgi:hypothetical protein